VSETTEKLNEETEAAEAKPAKKAAAKKPAAKAKAAPKPRAAQSAADADSANGEDRRGQRKVREGIVVSNKMQKTVVVMVQRRTQHALYGKVVIRSNKFKAHDEEQTCDIGDKVEIMETRPLSKEKRWRVTRILEKVK
jgi:small subunit ribosomal protein S17